MRNFRDDFEIVAAGGLLMSGSSLDDCWVAHPDVPLAALTGYSLAGPHVPPHEVVRRDNSMHAYLVNLLLFDSMGSYRWHSLGCS